jgi:uncharacterized protein YpmS
MTFYYENLLENHNYTAKPNVAWTANITIFELIIDLFFYFSPKYKTFGEKLFTIFDLFKS